MNMYCILVPCLDLLDDTRELASLEARQAHTNLSNLGRELDRLSLLLYRRVPARCVLPATTLDLLRV